MTQRINRRRNDELRPFFVTYDIFSQADASVLFELGNTKVLCAVTLQAGVPHFLRGKGVGWLNAEYAMLPTATTERTQRESTNAMRNGRSVEISRLIGRALRTVVDLTSIGERTIYVDCDVLQADGGTRTVSITAAGLALKRAQEIWLRKKSIMKPIVLDDIAAISVGVTETGLIVDPDYIEDSSIRADFNFVVTRSGGMIEVHGGAEHAPLPWEMFDRARVHALQATEQLFDLHKKNNEALEKESAVHASGHDNDAVPFFSLKNRFAPKQHP
jgi:ribonuclease PH